MEKERLLVVGGTGFVGRYLCLDAINRGYDVIVLGRHNAAWIEDNNQLKSVNTETYSEDIISELCAKSDVVINLAAARSTASFSLTEYMSNIIVSKECISACIVNKKKLVQISSSAVYGDDEGFEDEKCHPISLYGESKLSSDLLIEHLVSKENANIVSLRSAQVIGWGERKGYVLNTFIDNAASGIPLVLYGEGKSRRQYIYVKDLIDAIFYSIANDLTGIYNVGMADNISIAELALTINDVFNNSKIEHMEYVNEVTRNDLMSIEKMSRRGWKPKYSIREALCDMKKDRVAFTNRKMVETSYDKSKINYEEINSGDSK